MRKPRMLGLLSRNFFAIGEVEGPPLTIDEPERLVDKGDGLGSGRESLGVDTTHQTRATCVNRMRPVELTKAKIVRWETSKHTSSSFELESCK